MMIVSMICIIILTQLTIAKGKQLLTVEGYMETYYMMIALVEMDRNEF